MKSHPMGRFEISSCCTPTTPSRVRWSLALGSTLLPAGAKTPVVKLKRGSLTLGVPISSLICTTPSPLASFQQDAPGVVLQAPLDTFGPHVSLGCEYRPPRLSARVIFVW